MSNQCGTLTKYVNIFLLYRLNGSLNCHINDKKYLIEKKSQNSKTTQQNGIKKSQISNTKARTNKVLYELITELINESKNESKTELIFDESYFLIGQKKIEKKSA